MVAALGPGRFYGSALPRPWFFPDPKLNGGERVDPPSAVMDPLLSWAREAHWSMGGLSLDRRRLQGRIEGNIARLRSQLDSTETRRKKSSPPLKPVEPEASFSSSSDDEEEEEEITPITPSVSNKRRRVRKLGEEFDRIAEAEGIAARTRSRRPAAAEESGESGTVGGGVKGRRTSPRKRKSVA